MGDDFEKTHHDFMRIAEFVRSFDIQAHVVNRHTLSQLRLLPLWLERCLSIAPAGAPSRKLLPGRFLGGREMSKVEELTRLDRARIPTPKWREITPSTVLDPAEWGPYVVEKPSFGGLGAMVRIRRTSRVRYAPTSLDTNWRFGKLGGPMIVQEFIFTGEWPTAYRVVTFFGEVLLCYRNVTQGRGAPLRHRWDFGVGGISIVANTKDMECELVDDEELLALAACTHRDAFPDVPMLHLDILRDAESGRYFVLECHPAHPRWPFSHPVYLSLQQEKGLDTEGQFGGLEKAAHIIALKSEELATRLPCR